MDNNSLHGDAIDTTLDTFTEIAAHRRRLGVHGLFNSGGDAAFDYYLRPGGNSKVRVVSLSDLNPCGKVFIDDRAHEANRLETVLSKIASQPAMRIEAPGARKPELAVQAFLIRSSLRSPADTPKLLDLAGVFEELLFVTDEFRICSEVRADVLMLGRRTGSTSWVPVFIELKAVRAVAEPLRQLANIASLSIGKGQPFDDRLAGRDPVRAAALRGIVFTSFLRAATGITAAIDLGDKACIVIMPADPDGQPTRRQSIEDVAKAEANLVEFTKGDDYAFRRTV